MSQQLVSIIVNNFNYGRFLRASVESALNQRYDPTEVIVVDDGSTDQSSEVLASLRERAYVIRKRNGGQASAFNAGFAAARGDIIIFLDADDVLLPQAADVCSRAFTAPDISKVHWPMWKIQADGRSTGELVPATRLVDGDFRELVIRDGPDRHAIPENHGPPTSANAWSRRFLDAVLPMPERHFETWADMYLLNLAPLFGRLRTIDQPLGCYRVHGANDTLKPIERLIQEYLPRYEVCCNGLRDYLLKLGGRSVPDTWHRGTWYHLMLACINDIKAVVPEGESFILIDANSWGSGSHIAGRRCFSFTERDGVYWGAPADDLQAIEELERLRSAGAKYLFIISAAFWYLEYFGGFADHLRSRFRCTLENARVIVFDLS